MPLTKREFEQIKFYVESFDWKETDGPYLMGRIVAVLEKYVEEPQALIPSRPGILTTQEATAERAAVAQELSRRAEREEGAGQTMVETINPEIKDGIPVLTLIGNDVPVGAFIPIEGSVFQLTVTDGTKRLVLDKAQTERYRGAKG